MLALAGLGSGCAGLSGDTRREHVGGIELADVPFHPQEEFQCGPAALATLLNAAGATVTPDELQPQVYLPGRHGSLQAELLGAARRHDRLAYVIDPTPEALRAQLDAGKPVLVLQNFGSRGSPLWHYAVVIGYEPGAAAYLLRSGITRRQRLSARRFLATWERGDSWGMVLARPGELPEQAQATRYLQAAAGLEAAGRKRSAFDAYEAAVRRWPQDTTAWFALAGTQIALDQPAAAESTYRQLLRIAPGHTAAHNNLALLLARRGCATAANGELELAWATSAGRYSSDLADTAAELQRLAADRATAAMNCTAP